MNSALPRVTVVIPTINRVHYLKQSVESALAQTYGNLEILISNNNSVDDTQAYLDSLTDPRVRLLRQATTIPITPHYNSCLEAATGEYFLLLPDDDLLVEGAITKLVEGFGKVYEEGFVPGIVYGGGHIVDSNGVPTRVMNASPQTEDSRSLILEFLRGKRDLWFCGTLFRTADLRPEFPSEFPMISDSGAIIRIVAAYSGAAYVSDSICGYRIHKKNTTTAVAVTKWANEVSALAPFAIAELSKHQTLDSHYEGLIQDAINKVVAGIVVGRINLSPTMTRWGGLKEYLALRAYCRGIGGARVFLRGIIVLMLGKHKVWIRKILR
jgi:glycosyltransferase involved in cell wall biosynthesis